jgi:Tol biopolymer transport system component/tRNA A-37 threonylcarbamoyl transferase component Bud32
VSTELRSQLQSALSNSYTIDRELGGGGMSRVFLAEELELGRKVVIKVLAPELAEGLSAERFAREIKLAAALQQANIVPLLRTGTTPVPFYTMPFVEGESLRARLADSGALPEAQVIGILRDVARALSYAHAHGVVHRDIKPDNVLLSGGTAVVADFGIAKAIDVARTAGSAILTGTGVSIGTPAYMAPEQLAGDANVDERVDIYSLGTLAYELLTGHTPFHDRTPQKLIAAQILDAPPPIAGVRAELNALVVRCLAKEPGARPQSANEVLQLLDGLRHRRTIAPLQTMAAAALVLAALALGFRTYATRNSAMPLVLGATQQVTTTPGIELDPSISPDGKFIAYVAVVDGEQRVVTRPTGGERQTVVAPDVVGSQRWPRWSADGTTLLFSSDTLVYEAPAFGGTPRLLFNAGRDLIRPNPTATYSPDGKSVVFNTAEGIKVLERDGGEPRLIVKGNELHSAEWSPDGSRIAYVSGNRQWVNASGTFAPSAIWVTRVDKPAPVQVTEAKHINMSPVWLNDDALLYVSSVGGTRDIYQVQLASDGRAKGEPWRLTTGLEPSVISYNRGVHRLAYSVLRSLFNIWGGVLHTGGETPISELTEITHDNQLVEGISLSADGKTLAFDSNRRGNSDIYRTPVEGGEAVQLTRDSTDEFQPEWSRDGTHLAFYGTRTGTRDVYVMDRDGRNLEAVTNLPTEERAPTWSPDGLQVAYLSGGQGMTLQNVYVSHRLPGGGWSPGNQLTTKGAVFPRWSPDGKYISFSRAGDTMLLTVADGTERVVATKSTPVSMNFFATWTSDPSVLYVAEVATGRGEWLYWRVPLNGGSKQLLMRTGKRKGASNATFATDGKRIYVTLGGNEGDVWTVDVNPKSARN